MTGLSSSIAELTRSELKRILFISTSTEVGGTEKMLAALASHLNKTGIEVSVCSLKKKGEYAFRMEEEGIPVFTLEMTDAPKVKGLFSTLLALWKLVFLVRRLKPQIVHAFLFRANMLARFAGPLAGVQINISSIRNLERMRPYYFHLDRWTRWLVKHHVAVSESVRKETCLRSRIHPDRISVIHNGIVCPPPSCLSPEQAAIFRGALGFDESNFVCGTLARLAPEKALYVLLFAFARLRQRHTQLRLLIVGDGPERDRLQALAMQLDISPVSVFAGLQKAPQPFLQAMDLFILSSQSEGLPNSILEAMAMKVPVIATKMGGVPEVVIHGKTGLLFEVGDVNVLEAHMEYLLKDPGFRRNLALSAYRMVHESFRSEDMLAAYDALYAKLLPKKL